MCIRDRLVGDCLNEAVAPEKIREYIWFMETKQPYAPPSGGNPYYLGKHNSTCLLYTSSPEVGKAACELFHKRTAGCQPEDCRNLIHEIEGEHIRKVEQDQPFHATFMRWIPFFFVLRQ